MSYRNTDKMIFWKYRIVKNIIWSIEYIDSIKFRNNIMQLIDIVYSYILVLYSDYSDLMCLNDYYASMCIDEMYKRLMIETHKFS